MPWLDLIIYLLIFIVLIYVFDRIMIRVLGIPKTEKKLYDHAKMAHRKVDWILRLVFIIMIILGAIININRDPLPAIFILEPFSLLFILIYVSELCKAYFQWKYERERNTYKASLYRLLLVTIFLAFLLNKIGFFN